MEDLAKSASYCVVERIRLQNIRHHGLSLDHGSHHIFVSHVDVDTVSGDGFEVEGSFDVIYEYCTAKNIGAIPEWIADSPAGWEIEDGSSRVLLYECEVHDSEQSGVYLANGLTDIWVVKSRIYRAKNYAFRVGASGVSGLHVLDCEAYDCPNITWAGAMTNARFERCKFIRCGCASQ